MSVLSVSDEGRGVLFMLRFGLTKENLVGRICKPVPNGLALELLKLKTSEHEDQRTLCEWLFA